MSVPRSPLVIAERYELGQVIGQGGCGVVYRAFDRQQRQSVAVKVLSRTAARDPNMVERLVREQQIMLSLAGTCAVHAIDLCKSPSGSLCLVMEWLDGVDLEHHLGELEAAGEHVGLDRLIEIVAPVVETLQRAHAMDIVHRDIKPANIFLVSSPQRGTRLLDFGLSRMRSAAPLTAMGTVLGSPSYIAPESWSGNSQTVDHRADLYSLAVIVFRALTGQIPFPTTDWQEKIRLVTTADRPSLHALRPDLPPGIDDWAHQALAIDPSLRFNTARGMFTALLLCLGKSEAAIQAARPQVGPEMSPSEWRNALFSAWDAAKSLLGRLTGQRSESEVERENRTKPPPRATPGSSLPEPPFAAAPDKPNPLSLSRIPELSVELVPVEDGDSPSAVAESPAPSVQDEPAPSAAKDGSPARSGPARKPSTQRRSKHKHTRTHPTRPEAPGGKKSRHD
jgi:eukaryotic-like serine/threonine-protein kinase